MIVKFDKSFLKALDKIKDPTVLKRIETAIRKAEETETFENLSSTKKLVGFTNYYRIKVGDYRVGLELINPNEIRLITVLHRKDIYKKFP
ncbi:MAG: type II toxin-antitoxin system RelE family toxin [Flavobacteriales bacterium]|jgi:mRNA interferase RelE/StbE